MFSSVKRPGRSRILSTLSLLLPLCLVLGLNSSPGWSEAHREESGLAEAATPAAPAQVDPVEAEPGLANPEVRVTEPKPDSEPAVAVIERRYSLPSTGYDLVGEDSTVATRAEDTLIDLAARHLIGYNLIRSANPDVDAWMPGDGTQVLLPLRTILPNAPRRGIVINVPEMRLYYYTADKSGQGGAVSINSISVGRGEWNTPVTKTRVVGRAKDPTWYPPATIRAEHAARGDVLPRQVPAGPDNPLGQYLLILDIPSYFIHGTNKKFGIGMQVTHGCIRMYSQDIEQLAKQVPNNTPVTIINQTIKTGWQGDELYLEVHPPLEQNGKIAQINPNDVVKALVAATHEHPETRIDWDLAEAIAAEATGIPQKVGQLPDDVVVTDMQDLAQDSR